MHCANTPVTYIFSCPHSLYAQHYHLRHSTPPTIHAFSLSRLHLQPIPLLSAPVHHHPGLPRSASLDMPQRKRRVRNTVPTVPTPDSASNSLGTPSPSSQIISRSDTESDHPTKSSRTRHLSIDPTLTCTTIDIDPLHFSTLPPSSSTSSALIPASTTPTSNHFSVASVALLLFDSLVDWAVRDVAVQFKHRVFRQLEERRRSSIFSTASTSGLSIARVTNPRSTTTTITPTSSLNNNPGSKLLYSDKNVMVVCSICAVNISASRYAQHVEKCLGRGGRMSSRAATARLRASVERSEKEAAADLDGPPRRRRHHGNDAESNVGPGSHKRRKMSPAPAAAGNTGSQGSHHARSLPPSGRTRGSPR